MASPPPACLSDPAAARAYLESLRWPGGAVCPHCGQAGRGGRVIGSARPGLWLCNHCRCQFTVTVGTIYEASKLPLEIWLRALRLLCESAGGVTARGLQTALGITYKSAWGLLKKLRYAMTQPPLAGGLRKAAPAGGGKPARLHTLDAETVARGLLQIVPERKHPQAADRAEKRLRERAEARARRARPGPGGRSLLY